MLKQMTREVLPAHAGMILDTIRDYVASAECSPRMRG